MLEPSKNPLIFPGRKFLDFLIISLIIFYETTYKNF